MNKLTIAETEIGCITPIDFRGLWRISSTSQQQQQQQQQSDIRLTTAASAEFNSCLWRSSPREDEDEGSSLRATIRYPVPLRTQMTPPPTAAILPVAQPSRQRQTACMSTTHLPRI